LPEALLNYLVLLGWTSPSGEEILSQGGIIEAFSLTALSRNAPVHSRKKLEWLNSIYIRKMSEDQLFDQLTPYLEKAGLRVDQIDREYLAKMVNLLKENLVVLSQVEEYLGIFFDEKFSFEDGAKAVLSDSKHRETLQLLLDALKGPFEIVEANGSSLLFQLEAKTGRKGKMLYAPLRAGVTGMMKGPELVKILPLLGKGRIIHRLKMALELS
jgi:nondiscriminating glutamyl-tRNA synthetase